MTIGASRYDLVVGGAGPGGLATAIEARLRGLDVLVLERRPEAPAGPEAAGSNPHGSRRNVVFLRSSTSRALERWGVARDVIDGARGEVVRTWGPLHNTVAPLGHLEQVLLARARELGVRVEFGAGVLDAQAGADALTNVRTTRGTVRTPLYVEARGANAAEGSRAAAGRRRTAAGATKHLLVGHFPPQAATVPQGYRDRGLVGGRKRPYFWYGTKAGGLTMSIEAPAQLTAQQQHAWLGQAARRSGITGAAGSVQVVPVGSSYVPRPSAPGLALVGDAAGAVHPVTGQGTNQAIRDGRAAALLAVRIARGDSPRLAHALYDARVGSAHLRNALASSIATLPRPVQIGGLAAVGAAALTAQYLRERQNS